MSPEISQHLDVLQVVVKDINEVLMMQDGPKSEALRKELLRIINDVLAGYYDKGSLTLLSRRLGMVMERPDW